MCYLAVVKTRDSFIASRSAHATKPLNVSCVCDQNEEETEVIIAYILIRENGEIPYDI
ncbi:MAG: hypothetical protein WBE68_22505 [Candidatus Nitrosopolaris sp.]